MPSTRPFDPTGSVVRNLFRLQHLSNGLSGKANELLVELFDDIAAQMGRLDPTSPPQPTYRRLRVQKLVAEVEAMTGETFAQVLKMTRQDLARIGNGQGKWAADQLAKTIGTGAGVDISVGEVGINQMKAILDANPFQGETLAGWTESQKAATVRRVRRQLQLGMAEQETLGDMIRRVRGRSIGGGRFSGGVLEATTRDTAAIVRTGVNFIANEAHFRTFSANSDVTRKYEYTATLDDRTTLICASLDGQKFEYGKGPRPPQHYQCRSTITPVIDWAGLGVEPPPEGKRASADGPVKASTTYRQWLRDQPKSVQIEVLGRKRANLFRSNRATLRDMVTRDNRILTLEQLEAA